MGKVYEAWEKRLDKTKPYLAIHDEKLVGFAEFNEDYIDCFPSDFMFQLTKEELEVLQSKISTTKFSKTRAIPYAFTEQGVYMLATLLKSKVAINIYKA